MAVPCVSWVPWNSKIMNWKCKFEVQRMFDASLCHRHEGLGILRSSAIQSRCCKKAKAEPTSFNATVRVASILSVDASQENTTHCPSTLMSILIWINYTLTNEHVVRTSGTWKQNPIKQLQNLISLSELTRILKWQQSCKISQVELRTSSKASG